MDTLLVSILLLDKKYSFNNLIQSNTTKHQYDFLGSFPHSLFKYAYFYYLNICFQQKRVFFVFTQKRADTLSLILKFSVLCQPFVFIGYRSRKPLLSGGGSRS